MTKSFIKVGTRLNMRLESRINDSSYVLKSVYEKTIDENSFLISQPLENGEAVLIDSSDKVYISYTVEESRYEVDGYVEAYVKKGSKAYLKIKKTTELRRFDQRKHTRIKVEIRVSFEKLSPQKTQPTPALTLDISEGGVVLLLNEKLFVGEVIKMHFPKIKGSTGIDVEGEVCWVAEAAKSNDNKESFKRIAGFKFDVDNPEVKKAVVEYVQAVFDIMDI